MHQAVRKLNFKLNFLIQRGYLDALMPPPVAEVR